MAITDESRRSMTMYGTRAWQSEREDRYRFILEKIREIKFGELGEEEIRKIFDALLRFWAADKVKHHIKVQIRGSLDDAKHTLNHCLRQNWPNR